MTSFSDFSPSDTKSRQVAPREEIAVIGGGLGGCLAALMLIKKGYHVTLIEKQDMLLNGASAIASRLHLGGEYPLDVPEMTTAKNCLSSAISWKLLMPDTIYTPTPPMKFLIAKGTEQEAKLTLSKYRDFYQKIRDEYEKKFREVKDALKWDFKKTEDALFGSFNLNEFRRLMMDEKEYEGVVGGLQTQERGLNVPKYLTMIEGELKAQEQAGNLTILTGHTVIKEGIRGEKGHFQIHCSIPAGQGKTTEKIIESSQVVQAAWQGGPEILPLLEEAAKNETIVTVYKRGMILVDLPKGWKTPPAFIMEGKYGGMLSPYNDKTAICYLPMEEGGGQYKQHELTTKNPSLPGNWELSKKELDAWKTKYFEMLKERFKPLLDHATNPRLIVRDTLNFQKVVHERKQQHVTEQRVPIPKQGVTAEVSAKQKVEWVQRREAFIVPPAWKVKEGLFNLVPTKGTYSVTGAIQAAQMVAARTQYPDSGPLLSPGDILPDVLENREKYSLKHMQEPTKEAIEDFCNRHPPLNSLMAEQSWPGYKESWLDKVRQDPLGLGSSAGYRQT